jgi:hypothetical protein
MPSKRPFVRVLRHLDALLAQPRVALRRIGKSLALLGVGALLGGGLVAAKAEPQVVYYAPMSELPRSHAAMGIAWALAEFRDREGRCPSSLDELEASGIVDRVERVNAWGESLGWNCSDDFVIAGDRGNPAMRWDESVYGVRNQDLRNVDPTHAIPMFLRIEPQ